MVKVLGAIALAIALSACTSSVSAAPPAVGQSASAQAAATGSAAAAATTPAASAPASATPTAMSGGGLRVSADIDLGFPSTQVQPVAAEAPDGTVFYAAGQLVMVVNGTGAPQAAEHPGAEVLGLGASSTTLYVVTPQALIAYSRSTGDQTGRWALTGSPATPTTAGMAVGGNGDVWVWTDWATDSSGYEYAMVYAVQPGAAKPDVLSTTAQPGSLVTDGTHAYFLAASHNGHATSLMEASPGSQASSVAAAPTQALVGFSQSRVVLYAQPGSLYTYTPGAAGTSVVSTSVAEPVGVAGTTAGLLFLTCSIHACTTVTQVDQSSGTPQVSVVVPASSEILLGPDPAVLGVESGHLHLVRLS